MSFVIDAAVYLALAGAVFWLVVWLWRCIFRDVRTRLERFLFWGTWIGVSIMAAGWYHALTGERDFGFALMLLALGEAVVVTVGVNVGAALTFRKPYVPEDDPEFIAYTEERRKRLADMRRQVASERRELLR